MTKSFLQSHIESAVRRFNKTAIGCCAGDYCEGSVEHNKDIIDLITSELSSLAKEYEEEIEKTQVLFDQFDQSLKKDGTILQSESSKWYHRLSRLLSQPNT